MSITLEPVAIQLRRDTAANFTTANPVLAAGEMAFETDTQKAKIGDGATVWTALAYWSPGSNVTAYSPTVTTVYTDAGSLEIFADATAGAIMITLPTAVSRATGFRVHVIKMDSSANIVTVQGTSSQTVNGKLLVKLSDQYAAVQVAPIGGNWVIDGQAGTFALSNGGYVVSGAGDADWNGTYAISGIDGNSNPYWEKDSTHYLAILPGTGSPTYWQLTDTLMTGGGAYGSNVAPPTPPSAGTWTAYFGTAPAPTVTAA